ncbi:MAG: long-chain-fatty-acid--CoA ligase [Acetobacteraceae bacterium]|nr:long-chain-fatty-acid--CoA ligase [Acetobacteraceae bacterium]
MLGLMQQQPMMISSLLTHAARHHSTAEIVSKTTEGPIHRYTYPAAEARARRLVRVLQRLGVREQDRVGTLAWNGFRHFEIYYATSGMSAIVHTINPRLHPDDITYIINHAGDQVIFADTSFVTLLTQIAPAITTTVRAVVLMTDAANMPDLALPAGMLLHCYEDLMTAADDDYTWTAFDENTAAGLCYTSGTTGRPKGALYSHRSSILHASAVSLPDVFGLRATDRILPVVPMFHVNAWGIPYAAPLNGASIVFPGRYLDGASLAALLNEERVTFTGGVPTVWMGLLQHLRASGMRLNTTKRIVTGGSACPPLLIEAFEGEYGVEILHAWGMTELSPLGTANLPKPGNAHLRGEARLAQVLKQGRGLFGIDMKIVNDDGAELPWDGKAFGDLKVRGPWVCSAYYGDEPGSALDEDGWFATGDVATIDPDGYMAIVDRSKDVIKSGGEWISSIALENIAVSHPDVMEAAVVASRHPKWDERPLLLVVAKPGCVIDTVDVLKIYEGKIAKWWLPDEVIVVDELPHTATGKLQKKSLRDKYQNHYMPARK